jgi:antitoxin component of RelBE/YafQ-DinJ toxin-antitoxin module
VTPVSPNQPATPARTMRINDELWDAVKAEADRLGVTPSDVARLAIQAYLNREAD